MTSIGPPVCFWCLHRTPGADTDTATTCAAFPEGIPDAILYGDNEHRSQVRGDHGLRFSPRPEAPDRLK